GDWRKHSPRSIHPAPKKSAGWTACWRGKRDWDFKMNLDHLLKSLVAMPIETEWVEFKHNNDAPEELGEYIAALSNSAALHGRDAGYVVWGVEDGTKQI